MRQTLPHLGVQVCCYATPSSVNLVDFYMYLYTLLISSQW